MQSVHAQHAYNLSVVRLPDGPTHAPHASLLSSLGDAMTAAAALRATPASSAKPPLKLSPAAPTPRTPLLVDLRPRMPAVYDQGTLGSCTANALCGATQYMWPAAGPGSRLFVYYNERLLENDIPDDAGAYLCDGVIALEKYGVCSEARWPYDVAEFATAPPATCYADAAGHLLPTAHAVPPTLAAMKQCIALGYPFVVGIQIYGSFETAQGPPPASCRCPRPATRCWAATPCCASATTTSRSSGPCATRGAPAGAPRATSTCPTTTWSTPRSRPTRGCCTDQSYRISTSSAPSPS